MRLREPFLLDTTLDEAARAFIVNEPKLHKQ